MKIFITTHSDTTTSVSTSSVVVKKPGDMEPEIQEIEVEDSLGQDFLDNPSGYEIVEGKVVEKNANK